MEKITNCCVFLLSFFGVLLFNSNTSFAGNFVSGSYEDLIVGYDAGNEFVTGYYKVNTDNGVNPSSNCIFYFYGKINNNFGRIRAVTFEVDGQVMKTDGTLKLVDDNKGVVVKLAEPLWGCGRYDDFNLKEPFVRKLDFKGDWLGVRMVKTKKAYFYKSESLSEKRKAYVTTNDFVYIYKEAGEALYVNYFNVNGKKAEGWIKKNDLFDVGF